MERCHTHSSGLCQSFINSFSSSKFNIFSVQNDGPVPVVLIAYSDRFKDVHDYFRAVLKSEEKSKRVLDLTEDALELNPANYTVWNYRRAVLKAIDADLREEMQYSREMIEEHPKNYQVGRHVCTRVPWIKNRFCRCGSTGGCWWSGSTTPGPS